MHGKDKPIVQLTAILNNKKINSSMKQLHSEMSPGSFKSTPKINTNSLKILKEAGYDFHKSFYKRLSESNRRREEALDRRRHESEETFKRNRTPVISERSRELIGDRQLNIFKKLYDDYEVKNENLQMLQKK